THARGRQPWLHADAGPGRDPKRDRIRMIATTRRATDLQHPVHLKYGARLVAVRRPTAHVAWASVRDVPQRSGDALGKPCTQTRRYSLIPSRSTPLNRPAWCLHLVRWDPTVGC